MIDKTLGNRIVEVYRYIEEMEGKHHTFPAPVARRIVAMVKEVTGKLGNEVSEYFAKDLTDLEDKLHRRGTFNAIDTNLGVRGHLHAVIELHNLFGRTTGWTFDGNKQHYVKAGKTYCGLSLMPDSQPSYSVAHGWNVCKKCFDDYALQVAIDGKKYYNAQDMKNFDGRFKDAWSTVIMDYNFDPPKIEYSPQIQIIDVSTVRIKEKGD